MSGFVREKLTPILWLVTACVLVGGAYGIALGRSAPVMSPGQVFAENHAAQVCVDLDAAPTIAGVVREIEKLSTWDLGSYEVGVALAESVIYVCPHHVGLLERFVAAVDQHRLGVAV